MKKNIGTLAIKNIIIYFCIALSLVITISLGKFLKTKIYLLLYSLKRL